MALTVAMVAALRGRIKAQLTCQQCGHCIVRITGNAAIESNAGIGQRHLSAAANSATNQGIHPQGR